MNNCARGRTKKRFSNSVSVTALSFFFSLLKCDTVMKRKYFMTAAAYVPNSMCSNLLAGKVILCGERETRYRKERRKVGNMFNCQRGTGECEKEPSNDGEELSACIWQDFDRCLFSSSWPMNSLFILLLSVVFIIGQCHLCLGTKSFQRLSDHPQPNGQKLCVRGKTPADQIPHTAPRIARQPESTLSWSGLYECTKEWDLWIFTLKSIVWPWLKKADLQWPWCFWGNH